MFRPEPVMATRRLSIRNLYLNRRRCAFLAGHPDEPNAHEGAPFAFQFGYIIAVVQVRIRAGGVHFYVNHDHLPRQARDSYAGDTKRLGTKRLTGLNFEFRISRVPKTGV